MNKTVLILCFLILGSMLPCKFTTAAAHRLSMDISLDKSNQKPGFILLRGEVKNDGEMPERVMVNTEQPLTLRVLDNTRNILSDQYQITAKINNSRKDRQLGEWQVYTNEAIHFEQWFDFSPYIYELQIQQPIIFRGSLRWRKGLSASGAIRAPKLTYLVKPQDLSQSGPLALHLVSISNVADSAKLRLKLVNNSSNQLEMQIPGLSSATAVIFLDENLRKIHSTRSAPRFSARPVNSLNLPGGASKSMDISIHWPERQLKSKSVFWVVQFGVIRWPQGDVLPSMIYSKPVSAETF